jgi:raffinose/stachyose/melibiose transport system permease protein
MSTPGVAAGSRITGGAARQASVQRKGRMRKIIDASWVDVVAFVVVTIVFLVPFAFIVLTAAKSQAEASLAEFSWPSPFQLIQNLKDVLAFGNGLMLLAMWNSLLLTVGSVTLIVLLSALVAFVMQRRPDRYSSVGRTVILAGLIIPPAVVPTIFLLQMLGLYKTLPGLIMVEVSHALPFATLVLLAFVATIPREIDESAIMDGASPVRLFFSIILPLLWPAVVTVIVVQSVAIYNDFAGPLYFLPGSQNVTAQLTLFNFISQFSTSFNLLFADVVLITIPPLIVFLFFQRQIVAGMTSGAVKG